MPEEQKTIVYQISPDGNTVILTTQLGAGQFVLPLPVQGLTEILQRALAIRQDIAKVAREVSRRVN